MQIKDVTSNKIVGNQCSAFAIYPISYGDNAAEIVDYSDSQNNIFTTFDYTGVSSPDKYLDKCLFNIVDFYFNKTYESISLMPNICLSEIVFSFLDELSKYVKSVSSDIYYKTFNHDVISIEDILRIINPYIDAASSIILNTLYNGNENIMNFYVVAILADSSVNINKKHIEQTILASAAIDELIKRKITSIERVWNFMVTKKEADLVRYTSDFLDKNNFSKSVNYFFDNVKSVIAEMFEHINPSIRFNLRGLYYYELIHSDLPFPSYTIKMALKEVVSPLVFENHVVDNKEIYQFSMWSCLIEDFFENGLPFFNICRLTLQKAICDKLSVDEVGIIIGNLKTKMPL